MTRPHDSPRVPREQSGPPAKHPTRLLVALGGAAEGVRSLEALAKLSGVPAGLMSRRGRVAHRIVLFLSMLALAGQALADARVFDLAVRAGELPPDVRVIRVHQGDEVTLRWTTDRSLTVHLHGYDIEKKVSSGVEPTVMRFTARATGRFPIEAHGAAQGKAATLGYLEVLPR